MKINNCFYKLSPKLRELLFYFNFFKNPLKNFNNIIKIKQIYNTSKNHFNDLRDVEIYKSFKKLVLKTKDGFELACEYYSCNIISQKPCKFEPNKPILICLVKNDLDRIKEFYSYYSSLGVTNFAFIDNNSDDGTYEFLASKQNVFLFSCFDSYSTIKRQAWINYIMTFFGFDNWYIVVDSDELLVYNECEKYNIDTLIEKLDRKRIRALMIDMYSDGLFLADNSSLKESMIKKYCFFDSDSYEQIKHPKFELIVGGVRKRVFSKYYNISPFLVKYPIIFFEQGDIQYNSHFSYPFFKNFGDDLNLGLLHFKFMQKDLEKIKIRVKEGNYVNNSVEYRAYLEAYKSEKDLRLVDDNSCKFLSSESIYLIKFLKKINWKSDKNE